MYYRCTFLDNLYHRLLLLVPRMHRNTHENADIFLQPRVMCGCLLYAIIPHYIDTNKLQTAFCQKILREYFTSLTTARQQLSCKFRVVEWLHSAVCLMKYISSNRRLLSTAHCAHSKQLDWVSSIVTSLKEQK